MSNDICICNSTRGNHKSVNHIFELKYIASSTDTCGYCGHLRSTHSQLKHQFNDSRILLEKCKICSNTRENHDMLHSFTTI